MKTFSFSHQGANNRIWVVDPENDQVCTIPLDDIGDVVLAEQLGSTNQLSHQKGHTLWIAGGYGWSAGAGNNGNFVTFDRLIAVDVPGLIASVRKIGCDGDESEKSRLRSHFNYSESADFLAVTGGELEAIGDELYVVLGHKFEGDYNAIRAKCPAPGAQEVSGSQCDQEYYDEYKPTQYYKCQVASTPIPDPDFGGRTRIGLAAPRIVGEDTLTDCASEGQIKKTSRAGQNSQFHRRDLNVVPAIYLENGQPKSSIHVYGGVFPFVANEPGQRGSNPSAPPVFSPFVRPLYINADGVSVDPSNNQAMSHYETAGVSFFSEQTGFYHRLLLGGISASYCTDLQPGTSPALCSQLSPSLYSSEIFAPFPSPAPGFAADGALISCRPERHAFQKEGNAVYSYDCSQHFSEALLYRVFDHGAGARFLALPAMPAYENGVIRFDELPTGEWTMIGHVFGGIEINKEVLPAYPEKAVHAMFNRDPREASFASPRAYRVQIRRH